MDTAMAATAQRTVPQAIPRQGRKLRDFPIIQDLVPQDADEEETPEVTGAGDNTPEPAEAPPPDPADGNQVCGRLLLRLKQCMLLSCFRCAVGAVRTRVVPKGGC